MTTQLSTDMIPQELAHLPSEGRVRAVEMANELLNLGMELPAALNVAQARADAWLGETEDTTAYHVIPHPEGWQIVQSGNDSPGNIESTKQKALDAARSQARKESTRLIVHGQDGAVLSIHDYSSE